MLPHLELLTVLVLAATPVDPGDPSLVGWREALEEQRFSGVVSVRRGDRTLFEYADNGAQADAPKIGVDSVFWIGSVSKQFAAVSVLRLVEQGKIALDAPISQYLPALSGGLTREGKTCTVEQLLSHTCGLPAGSSVCPNIDLDVPGNRDAFLACVRGLELDFSPGSDFQYAGLGYGVAGILVAEISGQKYPEFLEEQFLQPLGMAETGASLGKLRERLARGELSLRDASLSTSSWLWLDPSGPGHRPASGNLFSTAADLHRWNQALHGGGVLRPEIYDALIRPRQKNYALGIVTRKAADSEATWLWHNGALAPMGWSSHVAWVPGLDLSVVVLTNRGPNVSQMDEIGFGLVESALSGSPPKLQRLPDKAYALDVVFAAVPLVLYAVLCLGLWFAVRGPRKTLTDWVTALIVVGAVGIQIIKGLDPYGDRDGLRILVVSVLTASVALHRRRWIPSLMEEARRRVEKRRLLFAGPSLLLLAYLFPGHGRLWLFVIAAALGTVLLIGFQFARRRAAVAA